ncbi:MAG: hypothetical protein GY780_17055 [bacterium]|nr:hypothetical protein [bacterium]
MKRFISIMLLLLACSLVAPLANAGENSFGMSWSSTIGLGDTGDFVPGFHARGFSLEYRNRVSTEMSWGFNAGYNVLADNKNETVFLDNIQATGNHGKYINTIPLYGAVYHNFGTYSRRSGWMYAGLNGGMVWLEKRTSLGLYALEDDNWHMALAPEFGYHLPWDSLVGHISVRYNYVFESGDVEAQQWLEFRVGFGL